MEHDCRFENIITKVEHDMYYGNGKPALTARMGTVEDRMDRIEVKQLLSDKKQNWMISLLIMTLIAVIVNLVKR